MYRRSGDKAEDRHEVLRRGTVGIACADYQLSVKVRAGTAAMAKSCYRLGTKVLFTGDSGATKVSDEQFWGRAVRAFCDSLRVEGRS